MKGILLVGAIAMTGNVFVNYGGGLKLELPLEMPPSYRQGWGRLDLSNSLPLAGSILGWSLQVRTSRGALPVCVEGGGQGWSCRFRRRPRTNRASPAQLVTAGKPVTELDPAGAHAFLITGSVNKRWGNVHVLGGAALGQGVLKGFDCG